MTKNEKCKLFFKLWLLGIFLSFRLKTERLSQNGVYDYEDSNMRGVYFFLKVINLINLIFMCFFLGLVGPLIGQEETLNKINSHYWLLWFILPPIYFFMALVKCAFFEAAFYIDENDRGSKLESQENIGNKVMLKILFIGLYSLIIILRLDL